MITGAYNPRQWENFRPISLTPFVFKTLERLVYWHMLESTLEVNPFDENQHAFRTNRGTETALHQAISEIEKGVLKGNHTLAVFLDVSSAFDKLSFKAAQKAMKAKGMSEEIRTWYQQYLENRISILELKGAVREIEIKSGTPQGGILSVILWNMAFDLLLKKLGKGKVKVIGFADES